MCIFSLVLHESSVVIILPSKVNPHRSRFHMKLSPQPSILFFSTHLRTNHDMHVCNSSLSNHKPIFMSLVLTQRHQLVLLLRLGQHNRQLRNMCLADLHMIERADDDEIY